MNNDKKIAIALGLAATAGLASYITRIKRDLMWQSMIMETTRDIRNTRFVRIPNDD